MGQLVLSNTSVAQVVSFHVAHAASVLIFLTVENTFALVLSSEETSKSGLDQILALGSASDSIRVKSEGTRVLVNAIKSLCASDPPSALEVAGSEASADTKRLRMESVQAVLTENCAQALARLIGRSGKYPILINEGTVALTLLSTQRGGGP